MAPEFVEEGAAARIGLPSEVCQYVAMAKPSLSLFFPAWNEEEYVERAVNRARVVLDRLSDDWEIIVVNDASTDRTRELAEALAAADSRIRCLTHEENKSLGGAMKTGFEASTKDIVIYSDIDLPFDLDELERALHLMTYLEADMISAFRFDRTSEGPRRIVYSLMYNFLIRTLFDVQIKDINFSFKVVHRRVLESIELKAEGGFIDAELVVKALKRGFRVFQMGVDYFPRTRGESTLASPRVIVKIVKEMASLFTDTRAPKDPVRPARLPPSVAVLETKKASSGR